MWVGRLDDFDEKKAEGSKTSLYIWPCAYAELSTILELSDQLYL